MLDLKAVFGDNFEAQAEYLIGKAQNEIIEGDGLGSPWHELVINSTILGPISALLWWADIAPDGSEEKAGQSQWTNALQVFSKDMNWGDRFVGSFARGVTFTDSNSIARGQDGEYYTYVGSDPFPKVVSAGINPSGDLDFERFIQFNPKPFKNISSMKSSAWLSTLPTGTRIEWQGYYTQSDGGGNRGILRFGAHAEDGGSIFSIDANTYIEANFKGVNLTLARFGANNTGVNVTDRVQAAIDYAQANNRPISEFSDSEVLINTVTVARADESTIHPLTLKGSGWSKTVFKAASVVDQMFLLEGSLAQSSNYNHISGVYLKGELKAKSGIKSSGAPHLTLRDVRGLNFTGEGLFDLANCWSSTIDNCKSSFNIGANAHGARLRNACFGTNIISSFFFGNDGWGLIVDPSISINISGGIEANKMGGLHASGVKGLNIDGLYTEGNGSVGDTLTAVNGTHPSRLFKCDILLNGTSSYNGTYVAAFPCEAVSIRNLTSQITTSGNTVIEVVAVNGLEVDLVKDAAPAGPTKNLININVVKDNSTAKNIDIGTATGYTNKLTYYADEFTSKHGGGGNFNEITFGRQYNLVNNPTAFSFIFNGGSGNIPQIIADAGYKYEGLNVYSLEIGSVGESNWFGEILDMDDPNNVWLRGKLVHVDMLVKTKGAAQVKTVVWPLDTASPLLSDGFSSSDFAYSNNTVVVMPSTGFVRLGFQLTNVANISTDTAEVAKFVIAPMGVDIKNI